MNLPDAPIAKEGFFVTHFLSVADQAKSSEFYVGILGGTMVKPENPCHIKLPTRDHSQFRRGADAGQAGSVA
jgi:hypothetical protein